MTLRTSHLLKLLHLLQALIDLRDLRFSDGTHAPHFLITVGIYITFKSVLIYKGTLAFATRSNSLDESALDA